MDKSPDCAAILPQTKKRKPGPRELAAAAVSISPRLLDYAAKVRTKGIPELLAACTAGTISVSRAAKIADAPREQQAELMAAPRRNRDDNDIVTRLRSGANQLIAAVNAGDCARALSAAANLQLCLDWVREAVSEVGGRNA